MTAWIGALRCTGPVDGPWGETAHYNFAVEHDGHFVRVQVKSTMFKDRGGYSCSVRGWRGPYEGDPLDFVAAYLILENLWYIIPAEMIRGQGSIAVYPYARYREAWHVLRGRAGKVGSIEACAEAVAGYAYLAESGATPIRMEYQPGGE